MRCPQCGNEAAQGAAFCARCGARLFAPKPDMVREYALIRILPSWWHFSRELGISAALVGGGVYLMFSRRETLTIGLIVFLLGILMLGLTAFARRFTSWSLTSDRLIERRGFLSSHRREMELADVRSIEVNRTLMQRMVGLGDVTIASAASAEFLIRMSNIPDPDRVAEMLRQARLKRLA
jgi:membrane protein YdbS with pleckstrin-like domain